MKPHQSREALQAQVVMLACEGVSNRAIARALELSRNTVRKLVGGHRAARDAEPVEDAPNVLSRAAPRAPRPTKLDDHQARITELLTRYPDITAQRVFEELSVAGYDGGYTAIKERVRRLRPKRPEPSLPTPVYGPGEMAESDWSPHTIDFTHSPRATVQVFAYTLTHSTRADFSLYPRSDLHALMDGHTAAFQRFGGAAHACKYDNQKAVVLRWEGSQPIYNPRFLVFAAHYEFRPVACRPRRPNDKPRVERKFWEFERSFLNGRFFRDLDDMRGQLLHWEDTIADLRPRRQRPRRPRMELFADEQPLLRPLPRHLYDTARIVYRLCSIDGFVSWEGNRYAVPYKHVTDILPVRITQRELHVYAPSFERVACHELAPRSTGQDVGAAEYHPRTRTDDGRGVADLDQLRETYAGMGDLAAAFLDALCAATPRLATYQARRILLLRERYATDDLCAALHHAQAHAALDHHAVERILAARAEPRRLAEYVTEDLTSRLMRNLRGPEAEPRDLTEYDRLPSAGGKSSQPSEPNGPHEPHETHASHERKDCVAPCHDARPHDPPQTTSSNASGEPSTSSD